MLCHGMYDVCIDSSLTCAKNFHNDHDMCCLLDIDISISINGLSLLRITEAKVIVYSLGSKRVCL